MLAPAAARLKLRKLSTAICFCCEVRGLVSAHGLGCAPNRGEGFGAAPQQVEAFLPVDSGRPEASELKPSHYLSFLSCFL